MTVNSAPYHPACNNNLAERAVKTFKQSMKKQLKDSFSNMPIVHFLFSYCITFYTATGISPAEHLFRRLQHSYMDLL